MITATGKCLGIHTDEFTDKKTGEVRRTMRLGIGMKKERGFDDEILVWKMTLDKELSAQLISRIESLKGKQVNAGCVVSEYSMNGKNGISYKFNGIIAEVGEKPAQAVKAA